MRGCFGGCTFCSITEHEGRIIQNRSEESILKEVEEIRDQAIAYLEQREAEMANQLSQTEAELRAAMEGLRDARTEAEELRSYIERQNSGS